MGLFASRGGWVSVEVWASNSPMKITESLLVSACPLGVSDVSDAGSTLTSTTSPWTPVLPRNSIEKLEELELLLIQMHGVKTVSFPGKWHR